MYLATLFSFTQNFFLASPASDMLKMAAFGGLLLAGFEIALFPSGFVGRQSFPFRSQISITFCLVALYEICASAIFPDMMAHFSSAPVKSEQKVRNCDISSLLSSDLPRQAIRAGENWHFDGLSFF